MAPHVVKSNFSRHIITVVKYWCWGSFRLVTKITIANKYQAAGFCFKCFRCQADTEADEERHMAINTVCHSVEQLTGVIGMWLYCAILDR